MIYFIVTEGRHFWVSQVRDIFTWAHFSRANQTEIVGIYGLSMKSERQVPNREDYINLEDDEDEKSDKR